jgi:ribonuclease T2
VRFIVAVLLLALLAVPAESRQHFHILAVSWQPAFCEGQPRKPECETQTEARFDASHFTLHGLWPQPRSNVYCGVDERDQRASENGRWDLLPETRLTSATRSELAEVMPGTQSMLDRHEWTKHGSCYKGGSAELYYLHSLRLMAELNRSVVRDYFVKMRGKTVRLSDIRARFDEAFGEEAGLRIRIACRDDGKRRLITEITLGLSGDPGRESLSQLLLASRPTDGGCGRGEIDRAGLQ